MAAAIVKLAKSPELRHEMGMAARKLGRDKFDRRFSYVKIIDAIESCTK